MDGAFASQDYGERAAWIVGSEVYWLDFPPLLYQTAREGAYATSSVAGGSSLMRRLCGGLDTFRVRVGFKLGAKNHRTWIGCWPLGHRSGRPVFLNGGMTASAKASYLAASSIISWIVR